MPKASSRNDTSSDSRISQLTSNEQSFNDRISLIVRLLNSRHFDTNQYHFIVQSAFHIESPLYILANDLATIQSELGAVDIWISNNGLTITGEVTN